MRGHFLRIYESAWIPGRRDHAVNRRADCAERTVAAVDDRAERDLRCWRQSGDLCDLLLGRGADHGKAVRQERKVSVLCQAVPCIYRCTARARVGAVPDHTGAAHNRLDPCGADPYAGAVVYRLVCARHCGVEHRADLLWLLFQRKDPVYAVTACPQYK